MTKKHTCGKCFAWLIQTEDTGICSRHAPRPIIKIYGNAESRSETLDVPGIFSPITHASFYCAEYMPEPWEEPQPQKKRKV
jgi:hypothetical protein